MTCWSCQKALNFPKQQEINSPKGCATELLVGGKLDDNIQACKCSNARKRMDATR